MLKDEMNRILRQNGWAPHGVDEVPVFRALIKAIEKDGSMYATEYHGNKGQVKHLLQYAHTAPTERQCEIADMLMLFFGTDDELRFTFLQNKRDKKTPYAPTTPLRKTKGDPLQWDLLHYRCDLSDGMRTNLPQDCLRAAILNSAATYGIFVNETATQDVDMTYHIARDLIPVTPSPISPKPRPRTYAIGTNYNRLHKVNGYWEVEGTPTLGDFEVMARAMFVGSPICPRNPRHREFMRTALSFAVTCLQSERNHDDNIQKRRQYLERIYRYADRYEIELSENTMLPYSLTLWQAREKVLFTDTDETVRTESGFTPVYDTDTLLRRCQSGCLVFIDTDKLIDGKLENFLVCNESPAYFMQPQDDGYVLIRAYDYLVKGRRA